jgi:ubiquinone/menaquinone biosynthesis C-methylase UbiE
MGKTRLILKMLRAAVTERSNRGFYDRIAPYYDSIFTEHLVHADSMVEILRDWFPEPAGVTVLDLGCGTGLVGRKVAEAGYSVIGTDISHESLRAALDGEPELDSAEADAHVLPFRDGSVDAIVSLGSWRHFSAPGLVLDEICRILRGEGLFVVGYFPPKIGGLVNVPENALGEALAAGYSKVVRRFGHDDEVRLERGGGIWADLEERFGKVERFDSGKRSYVIEAWGVGKRV